MNGTRAFISQIERHERMTGWESFTDSFFNARVMAQYLPKIVEGFFLTVELALLIIVAGLALGLLLALVRAFGIRPLNWLIIFVVDCSAPCRRSSSSCCCSSGCRTRGWSCRASSPPGSR
jgi:hypothetical protein